MKLNEIAEEYFTEGLNPIPLKADKKPIGASNPWLYERIDNIPLRFLNAAKIGVACGAVSDYFYLIDFDCKNGQDIATTFNLYCDDEVIHQLKRENAICTASTPSGGFHIYLKCDTEHRNSVFSRHADGTVMIESRGTGGYAVVPPSQGYNILSGDLLKLEHIPVEVFHYLIDRAKSFNQYADHYNPTTKSTTKGKQWPEQWPNDTAVNRFKNEGAIVAKELLVEHGWRYIKSVGQTEHWERPSKNEGATSATFGARFNMFYVFSSNAQPFQANTAYNPFDILVLLKFNGDYRAAKAFLEPEQEEQEQQKAHEYFPIDVFPQAVQDHILELKRTLNFHPDFTAAAAMFAVSAINGNCYKLKVKNGWEASTIFWFAVVGYPGTIKTHPVKTMLKPITSMDARSKNKYDRQLEEYHQELEAQNKSKKPVFKQIIISDYTVESLHPIHSYNKRGLGLYKDELKGFLNDMNKYRKGSDEEFWLESFNNGSYIVNRVTKDPIMVENICISIIGTIQHDVLHKVVTDYAGNGLIDRFLFTSAEDKVYPLTSEEIDPIYAEFWEDKLNIMNELFVYDIERGSTIIEMSPEAFEAYQIFDAEYVAIQNSPEQPQEIKNYLSKMKTYIPRFALLLAIFDTLYGGEVPKVGKKQMEGAKRIADYFVKTASAVFASSNVADDIKQVESSMRGKTKNEKIVMLSASGFKQTEIAKYFGLSRQMVSKILKKST